MHYKPVLEQRPFDEPHPCLAGEWAGRGRTVSPRLERWLFTIGAGLVAAALAVLAAGGCLCAPAPHGHGTPPIYVRPVLLPRP